MQTGYFQLSRRVGIFARLSLVFSLQLLLPLWGADPPVEALSADQRSPGSRIEIRNEPETVDPATVVPPRFAALVTVQFDGEPLKNVITWLQRDQAINVLVDYKALANAKLLDTEPVYEELDNAPLYLLLSRLERLGLAWYEQDGSLFITSHEEYLKHDTTVPYNLGDLVDAGYLAEDLVRTIKRFSGGRWEIEGGVGEAGTAMLLGDVLLIRQTADVQREVAGLLAAIRHHGRRTLTLDAPQNAALRTALNQKITVDFQETPLIVAAQELSRQAQIRVRIDRVALSKGPVRERSPVSVKLIDQKLSAVLRAMLSNQGLDWHLRDGVLWITTSDSATRFYKTAAYDVRDLCRDQEEAIALRNAILAQTRGKWRPQENRGGVIEVLAPGCLVLRNTEATLDEVLQLLESYRTALRASKLRVTPGPDPTAVITGYYRMPSLMADDLQVTLPRLVESETWKSAERPDAIGSMARISVKPTLIDAKGNAVVRTDENRANVLVVESVVLVIVQSRAAHQKIGKLLRALENSGSVDAEAALEVSRNSPEPIPGFGRQLIPAKATE